MTTEQNVLCLNTGSSSLKFALYDLNDLEDVVMHGSVEKIGLKLSRIQIQEKGSLIVDKEIEIPSHQKAVLELLEAMNRAHSPTPVACVHRIVHGGPRLAEPVMITDQIKAELKAVSHLAPLHIPIELAVIEAIAAAFPDVSQIGCFDTAFHRRMPDVAKRLPLHRSFWDEGIRRYGFHGLSYESIVSQLENQLTGRTIIAHLGNGCSMAALKDGVPQDTTMGLTPTGGLMMGTRSGDLDPGVLFYLLRKANRHGENSLFQVEHLLNDESGLLGVSGVSRNMEDLLKIESESIAAQEAIELFCYEAKKFIGSLFSVLGGLDTLVFTGGMGANSAVIRRRICEELKFLDMRLDPTRNESSAPIISRDQSVCCVRTLQTNENLMMARHALALLSPTPEKGRS